MGKEELVKAISAIDYSFLTTVEFKNMVCKHCQADCKRVNFCKYIVEHTNTNNLTTIENCVDVIWLFSINMKLATADRITKRSAKIRKRLCKVCNLCKTYEVESTNIACITAFYDHIEGEQEVTPTNSFGFGSCFGGVYNHDYRRSKAPSSIGSLNACEIWNTNTG